MSALTRFDPPDDFFRDPLPRADVLVMGCAGMARFREPLERELGIPIVEPTQAAVTMALGRVRLGWGGRPLRGS